MQLHQVSPSHEMGLLAPTETHPYPNKKPTAHQRTNMPAQHFAIANVPFSAQYKMKIFSMKSVEQLS